ncbi:acetolactate synthase large subunit [Bacillus salipaludis]|uniref:Acetolactate synthase large subunit n=1 Tax=Bacillus salipaludis TaxID=2547811 RepID=A0A4R5VUE4_9BACI|nr:acetolactate synthase large subunit [Bacillus salipaludis]MDQ6600081.1 acetolactate synthase large subunit [Bacillus salipaludis]TDK62450.1 acetolactate synthase large subunit [Bacillus salipaludis]
MKASDLLVYCLENEGVEFIFGIIGSEVIDLADSLSKSEKIKYITVRHEQGAAFMADVYGRLSGKPGVCLATLGPGATNLLTGIASANLDHSPVVAITGQKGLNVQHKNAHQYVEIVKVFEPAAKWSVQLKDANTIPEIIRKSFRVATSEKPGAVAIELPENIAKANTTTKPLTPTPLPMSVPSGEALREAARLLNQCKKPFIILGNGVIRQNAVKEVQTFIERLGCPTANSFMAKGILSKEHPQNYYSFGFNEKDYAIRGMEESDLLVVIGFDINEKLPSEWNKKKVSVLHIDPLPAEVEVGYPVVGELVGNLKETLRLIFEQEILSKPWQPAGDLKKRIEDAYSISENVPNPANLTLENILHVIEKLSSEQTVVISDVGAHKVAVARTFQPKHANQLVISNGLASMGISIPGAIGAKLAAPEKTVIVLTGDGGALMNFAELETAKRLGLTFIIILLNDSMLKLEVEAMNKAFGENYGVTFSNPDFVQLVESFGAKGMRATQITEFEEILAAAMGKSQEICLIDAILQEKV